MAAQSNFAMNLPISVSGFDSVVSDIETSSDAGGDRSSATVPLTDAIAIKLLESNKGLVLETPEVYEGFEFSDGDTCVLVSTHLVYYRHTLTCLDRLGTPDWRPISICSSGSRNSEIG